MIWELEWDIAIVLRRSELRNGLGEQKVEKKDTTITVALLRIMKDSF